MTIYRLSKVNIFPHPEEAEPDGLLAIGGDLSPERLIMAYAQGIFPWYNLDDPILWWSPTPRMIMFPEKFKVSKSLQQVIRKQKFEIRTDTQFEQVITNCSKAKRPDQQGTWINDEMIAAYSLLNQVGLAHSFEVYYQGELAGGLYGISLGAAFFGESMFHQVTDASKVAFYYLCQFAIKNKFHFIDCQMPTSHLQSLGAEEMCRTDFLDRLSEAIEKPTLKGKWNYIPE